MPNNRKRAKSMSNRKRGNLKDLPVTAKQFKAKGEQAKGGAPKITVTRKITFT